MLLHDVMLLCQVFAHIVRGTLGILHNIISHCPEYKQLFRDHDVLKVRLRRPSDHDVRQTTTSSKSIHYVLKVKLRRPPD